MAIPRLLHFGQYHYYLFPCLNCTAATTTIHIPNISIVNLFFITFPALKILCFHNIAEIYICQYYIVNLCIDFCLEFLYNIKVILERYKAKNLPKHKGGDSTELYKNQRNQEIFPSPQTAAPICFPHAENILRFLKKWYNKLLPRTP